MLSASISEPTAPSNQYNERTANIVFRLTVGLVISFVPCHILLLQLTVKVMPFKRNCGISVGWKKYCLRFVSQHAYISVTLFHSCSSVLLHFSFQKTFQSSFYLLLQTRKPNLNFRTCKSNYVFNKVYITYNIFFKARSKKVTQAFVSAGVT